MAKRRNGNCDSAAGLSAHHKSPPVGQGNCPQRKCVANGAKTIATLSSQLRSTQKFFPPTNSACPATETRCDRGKNCSRGPNRVAHNANALRTAQKRLQHCNALIAAAIDTKILPADQFGLPPTETRCDRRK